MQTPGDSVDAGLYWEWEQFLLFLVIIFISCSMNVNCSISYLMLKGIRKKSKSKLLNWRCYERASADEHNLWLRMALVHFSSPAPGYSNVDRISKGLHGHYQIKLMVFKQMPTESFDCLPGHKPNNISPVIFNDSCDALERRRYWHTPDRGCGKGICAKESGMAVPVEWMQSGAMNKEQEDLIMCAYFIFQVGFIYISRC